MSRRAIIIPNTDKIPNSEVLTKNLEYNESHALGVIDFSFLYNLGITYESIGLSSMNYCSEKWYQEVARLGHVFLRLENDQNAIYLPSNISLNQFAWFKEKQEELEVELVNLSIQVIDTEGNILLSESTKYTPESDKYLFKMLYMILEEQSKSNKKFNSR